MGDALTRLADAVEAGEGHYDILSAATEWDSDNSNGLSECVVNAFHGSLDAAKAMHDAVLPGWRARVDVGRRFRTWVISPNNVKIDVYSTHSPARAWLLAILRALAQVQG